LADLNKLLEEEEEFYAYLEDVGTFGSARKSAATKCKPLNVDGFMMLALALGSEPVRGNKLITCIASKLPRLLKPPASGFDARRLARREDIPTAASEIGIPTDSNA
jgi:hypothetical protein